MAIVWPILIIFLVLFLSIPTIYSFLIGAPIVFSPKKALREALAYCQTKPGDKFYDLGAGTGRAMIIAAKEFGADVIGFELSPPLFAVAKINLFLHRAKNPKVHLKNFYKSDLSEANIIFCFLTPEAMKKLKPKFEKELKAGTKVISYGFSIEGWNSTKIINNGYPGRIFIYKI